MPHQNSSAGLIGSGPDDLSKKSRFMLPTTNIMPTPNVPFHSIISKKTQYNKSPEYSDGIVPYTSSHLDGAVSETVIKVDNQYMKHLKQF